MAIEVENIKCGGCANSITGKLMEDERIQTVEVDVDNGIVTLEANSDEVRIDAITHLLKMGYPETGSVEGLKAVKAKASSFVSCAVGRISQSDKS
ncbi:MAG: heavy metal transporter [Thiothrix sp.]|nr:MAG: heavy metal transporter [Thiothrix sp.]